MSRKSFASVHSSKHPLRLAASLFLASVLSITAPSVALADDEGEAEPSVRIARVQDQGPFTMGIFQAASFLQVNVATCSQDLRESQAAELQRRDLVAAGEEYLATLTNRAEKALTAHQIAALGPIGGEIIDDDTTPQAAAPSSSTDANVKLADTSSAEKSAQPASDTLYDVIYYNGEFVPFVQGSFEDTTAPQETASTWFGTGSVTDNSHTYFIGHNPGVFTGVMNLKIGDEIVVWDHAGNSHSYYVYDAIIIPNESNYFTYEDRLTPLGEAITLQTCCADNVTVRCVMAH